MTSNARPGWDPDWKVHSSNNKLYKQLHDIKGKPCYTLWKDTNIYRDNANNKRVDKTTVDAFEASIVAQTPRTTPTVTVQKPQAASGYSATKPQNVEIRSKAPQKVRDDDPSAQSINPEEEEAVLQKFLSKKAPRKDVLPTGDNVSDGELDDLRTFVTLAEREPKVMSSWFFAKGRVFRINWAEPKGVTSGEQSTKEVHMTLRPFVVVKDFGAHCLCLPIYSYKGKGVAKASMKQAEIRHHAIIHMDGTEPQLVPGEQKFEHLMQKPFSVKAEEGATFHPASRVRFDMTYTVKYNLGVINIGKIPKAQLDRLTKCWDYASGPDA